MDKTDKISEEKLIELLAKLIFDGYLYHKNYKKTVLPLIDCINDNQDKLT